jgi:hypothetical protein
MEDELIENKGVIYAGKTSEADNSKIDPSKVPPFGTDDLCKIVRFYGPILLGISEQEVFLLSRRIYEVMIDGKDSTLHRIAFQAFVAQARFNFVLDKFNDVDSIELMRKGPIFIGMTMDEAEDLYHDIEKTKWPTKTQMLSKLMAAINQYKAT